MNKTIIISLLGIIIVAGAIFVFVTRQPSNTNIPVDISEVVPMNDQSSETSLATAPTATPVGKKMAFGDFVKQGGSYKCTVSEYLTPQRTESVTGTIHLSNRLVRGDFSFDYQGTNMKTSFIVRDGFVYTWIPGETTGYKGQAQEQAPAQGMSSWTPDMIGDYDCQPSVVRAEMFTTPANVTFKSI
jgi:hypothetical protein